MSTEFDYKSSVKYFSARNPLISYMLTQIYFWVLANMLLTVLTYLQMKSIIQSDSKAIEITLLPFLILGLTTGITFGILIGLSNFYLDKYFNRRQSLGILIFIKLLIGLAVLSLVFALVRYVLYENLVEHFVNDSLPTVQEDSWRYLFFILLLTYGAASILINFVNQMQRKFGPGVLLPILFGKYNTPQEEERIFLFMDLKSSTTLAEQLGHLKYSSMIREAIFDINELVPKFDAEVYQYVGDEIVITWRIKEGLEYFKCVEFYFACERQFEKRSRFYKKRYGQLPFFKAGMNMGIVAAVEIGEVKRDIAYHGDTINIAARIQSKCNDLGKVFLASRKFAPILEKSNKYLIEEMGNLKLKGKVKEVAIISIEEKKM